MSNSTYISDELVDQLVAISGSLIREFLSFLTDPTISSVFSKIKCDSKRFQEIKEEYQSLLDDFAKNPQDFSDQALVAKGAQPDRAHIHLVRIEVRTSKGIKGAALVASRGICKEFRSVVLETLETKHDILHKKGVDVKLSGTATFEFTRHGVDKALTLLYFNESLRTVLETINYSSGPTIDASLTRTMITADGDGTTYGQPYADQLPLFEESPAVKEVIHFLENGGVYAVISGNSLQRTFNRIKSAIPIHLRHRFLICANGGANLAYINSNGELVEFEHYRENALDVLKDQNKAIDLDVIYIGDDGSVTGNDFKAFDCLGSQRSFVVAENDNPFFESKKVLPGKERATADLLKKINAIEKKLDSPLFTDKVLKELL